jgi:hypothetical protein
MKLPFTSEQFFHVFENYNQKVFPAQIGILIIGFIALFLLHSRLPRRHRLLGNILGFLWIWMGLIYHLWFFTPINKAAYLFGALFILQGGLFIVHANLKKNMEFRFTGSGMHYIAYLFIFYGLLLYPFIGFSQQQLADRTISLGLPCPTTIFTFGLLMLTGRKIPLYLLIIPGLWSVVGLSATINFGIFQDFMLIVVAVTAIIYLISKNRRTPYQPSS